MEKNGARLEKNIYMTCFCIRFCTTVLKIIYVLYSAILSQGYFKTLAGVARVLHRETCNQEMRTNRDIKAKPGSRRCGSVPRLRSHEIRFNSTVAEPSAGSHPKRARS